METDTMTATEPRAWVGCLACYNDGRLVGEWVEGTEAGEITTEDLHASQGVTIDPLYGPHEELWVMDHEGYGPLIRGECSPSQAQELAELLDSVPEHHRAPFVLWVGDDGDPDDFEEAYRGEWDSEREYAEEFAEDVGYLAEMPEHLRPYFDVDAFARDLFMGDVYSEPAPGCGVYVFRRL